MYRFLANLAKKFLKKSTIYKYGFNFSPMYRRSTGNIYFVSEDLHTVKVKIPLSYKNVNYVGTIFGGSMLSATDPIYMIQLMNIFDENYVVWDKAVNFRFKRPAKETAYAEFVFTPEEIEKIKADVAEKKEIDIVKTLNLTNKDKSAIFAELTKTIYVAEKAFYKEKLKKRAARK